MTIARTVGSALVLAACAGGVQAQQWKYSETNTSFRMTITTTYQCDMETYEHLPSASAIATVNGESCGYPNPVTFEADPDEPGEITSDADAYVALLVCPSTLPPGDACKIAKAHYYASAGYNAVTDTSSIVMGFLRRESREYGDCPGCESWGTGSGGCSIVAAWDPVTPCTQPIESVEVDFIGDSETTSNEGPCFVAPDPDGDGGFDVGEPIGGAGDANPLSEATFAGFQIDFFDSTGAYLSSAIEQSVLLVDESGSGNGQFTTSVHGDLLDGLVAGAGDHTPLQVAVPAGATSAQYSGELYTIDSALRYDVNADGSVDYYDRLELGGALNSALGDAGYTLRADLDRDLDVDAADADILEALSCMADLNADGLHNFFDVSVFTGWLNTGDLNADLTGDGLLNFFDLSVFLEMYNVGCP